MNAIDYVMNALLLQMIEQVEQQCTESKQQCALGLHNKDRTLQENTIPKTATRTEVTEVNMSIQMYRCLNTLCIRYTLH